MVDDRLLRPLVGSEHLLRCGGEDRLLGCKFLMRKVRELSCLQHAELEVGFVHESLVLLKLGD